MAKKTGGWLGSGVVMGWLRLLGLVPRMPRAMEVRLMACLLHGGSGGMAAPSLWPGALGGGLDSGGEGAAVDGQQRAVDEGRFVRGEECHGVRDLPRGGRRDPGGYGHEGRPVLAESRLDALGLDDAGHDGVDPHPGRAVLTGPGPGQLAAPAPDVVRRSRVLPVTEPTDHIDIPETDVRVDVYRSSGPGGQSVNTTDSAVRLTHIPTGIVVTCQNEKSQLQNKVSAMRVLQAKLLERKRLEERAELDALKGDGGSSWGDQTRSYVLHPYQMVKDLRTDYEVGNPAAVLDGDIDGFLEAGIRWRNRRDDE